MDSIFIGIIALGVAVLGIVAHAWRFRSTGAVSFATLWLLVPLLGAMIAFLLTPPSLLTVSLGGATAALAFLTLAATILLPALLEGRTPESVESHRESRDRAA